MTERRRREEPRPWLERLREHDERTGEHTEEGRKLDEQIKEKEMELHRLHQERGRHLDKSGRLARGGRQLRTEWERGPGDVDGDDFRGPEDAVDPEARRVGAERYAREDDEIVSLGIQASGDPAAPDLETGRQWMEQDRYGAPGSSWAELAVAAEDDRGSGRGRADHEAGRDGERDTADGAAREGETVQEHRHDERPPEGTGDRGTNWYYTRRAEHHMERADLADDAQERTIANDYADFYGRLADDREGFERAAELAGVTPNESARRDLEDAMNEPAGKRQAAADDLGLDYTEEELEEMGRRPAEERHREDVGRDAEEIREETREETGRVGPGRSSSGRRFGPGRGRPGGIGMDRDDEDGRER